MIKEAEPKHYLERPNSDIDAVPDLATGQGEHNEPVFVPKVLEDRTPGTTIVIIGPRTAKPEKW